MKLTTTPDHSFQLGISGVLCFLDIPPQSLFLLSLLVLHAGYLTYVSFWNMPRRRVVTLERRPLLGARRNSKSAGVRGTPRSEGVRDNPASGLVRDPPATPGARRMGKGSCTTHNLCCSCRILPDNNRSSNNTTREASASNS